MSSKIRIFAIVLMCVMACITMSSDACSVHIHSFSQDWICNDTDHWHSSICDAEADCIAAVTGLSSHSIVDGTCLVCGFAVTTCDEIGDIVGLLDNIDDSNRVDIISDDQYDNKPECTEHNYLCQQIKAADCTEDGENKYVCSICGDIYTEAVSSLGHDEVYIRGKAPTCSTTGLSDGIVCSICGEVTQPQFVIPFLNHSFESGACSTCGEVDPNYIAYDPFAINVVTTDNNCWVDLVSFTASESGEYTFYLPAGLGAWDSIKRHNGTGGPVVDSLHSNYVDGLFDFTVKIAAGNTYEFYIAAMVKQGWIIRWSFEACDVEENQNNVSEILQLPLLIGATAINADSKIYLYTADSDGKLVLSVGNAIMGSAEITYSVNDSESMILEIQSSVTLDLTEGDKLTVYVVANGYSSLNASWTVNETSNAGEAPDEGKAPEVGEIPDGGETPEVYEVPDEDFIDISGTYLGTDDFGNQLLNVIIDSTLGTVVFNYYHPLTGPNVVNATYEIIYGTLVLYNESGVPLHPLAGTLTLENNLPVAASFNNIVYKLTVGENNSNSADNVEIKVISGIIEDNVENILSITPEDISVDKMYVFFTPENSGAYDFLSNHIFVVSMTTQDGASVEKNDYEYYLLESQVKYIAEISLEYISRAGDYSITPVYFYPEGHPKNPVWCLTDEMVTATYKGENQPVWYQFYANVTGKMTISVETRGVTVMVAAVPDFNLSAVETKTFDVVAGRKYYISLAAYDRVGEVKIKFKITIKEDDIKTNGSVNSPYIFDLGDTKVDAKSSDELYFIYKATNNGTLTLSANNNKFVWYVTDFSTPVDASGDEINIHLNMGEVIYLYVKAGKGVNNISFNASFENDPTEVWAGNSLVLDGSRPNVIDLKDNTYATTQISGSTGEFIVSWDRNDATVIFGGVEIESGSVVSVDNPWFGPYFKIYLDDYAAGNINLIITAV